jgi:tRNA threonylcarbamoyladenosine biosynthesis protein TsaB
MRIIALDASTEQCAVALGDGAVWRERVEAAGQRHSELLLPMVQELLAQEELALSDLDGIAFGAGPGSFTGLRIACGVAQGLGLGTGLPIVGVPTLEAMAESARTRFGATRVIAALDARTRIPRGLQRDGKRWRMTSGRGGQAADAPLPPGDGWIGAGGGFAAYPELRARLQPVLAGCHEEILPAASAIGALALLRFAAGEGVAARDAAPLYVRQRVALTVAERAAGKRL